jgi:hypothetical protein
VRHLDSRPRGTAVATIHLLEQPEAEGVGFVSQRDGFDPSTPAGRLTRNVLVSVDPILRFPAYCLVPVTDVSLNLPK